MIGGEASGQPMQIPVVDIVEIGAGGGSIAWCDPTGGIHVGPKSAGADPGPAAYGKGSTDPVVTDANLVLGRINAERFLNGAMKLDVQGVRARHRAEALRADPARREGGGARHRADRRRRDVARGARGVGQEGRRSARDRDDRVRRRGPAACGRHRQGDLHSEGHHPEAAGHVLGARHADGVVAAGFRAHAVWPARLARRQAGRSACSPNWRDAGQAQLARDGIDAKTADFAYLADLRYVGQEHTIAIPVRDPKLLSGDFAPLREAVRRRARPALRPGRAGRAARDRQPAPRRHRGAAGHAGRALAVGDVDARSRRSPTSGATSSSTTRPSRCAPASSGGRRCRPAPRSKAPP